MFLGISFLCGNIKIKLLHFYKEIILKAKSTKLNLNTIKDHTEIKIELQIQKLKTK